MTPALPALDALLKEVDRAVNDPRSFREDAMDWSLAARLAMSDAAPRLAAMLRVAVEALYGGANLVNGRAECRAALARIERIAAGDQGEA